MFPPPCSGFRPERWQSGLAFIGQRSGAGPEHKGFYLLGLSFGAFLSHLHAFGAFLSCARALSTLRQFAGDITGGNGRANGGGAARQHLIGDKHRGGTNNRTDNGVFDLFTRRFCSFAA